MKYSFRPMTVDDVADAFSVRLSTIENAVTMDELARDYGIAPASLRDAMRSHVSGWMCQHRGEAVGFAMGDRSTGEVVVIAVRPEHVARGIGKELLRRVEEWLFSAGHQEIWLRSNPDPRTRAFGFYRRLGWKPSGDRQGDDEILVYRLDRPR